MIGLIFGVVFFVIGVVVGGGVFGYIGFKYGKEVTEKKYGKNSDFKKVEKVTYEKKN
jgi:hypothetical protein